MNVSRNLRLRIAVAAFAGLTTVALAAPAIAGANVVDDLLSQLGLGGQSSQPAAQAPATAPAPSTKSGAPPSYVPPLHGTNPHGQGEAATVSLAPGDTNPVSGTPGEPETVVLGSSKGEQNPDGTYHGHINILSLGGAEILSVDSNPGETNNSPVAALQTGILDPLCSGSGGNLCVTLLQADSATTDTGSTNTFRTAGATVGTGGNNISLTAASSTGNISSDGTCQTSTGSSDVADASVLGIVGADAISSDSQSTACNNGTAPTVTQSSNVVNLNGAGIALPVAGCDDGTPNSNFDVLAPLLSAVCNADDTTSGQTTAPYGVREGLTAFVLALENGPVLVKGTTAGAESHAVAPPGGPVTPPPVTPPGGGNGGGNGNNNNGGNGNNNGGNGNGNGGNGSGTGETGAGAEAGNGNGNGSLAFTGANLLWLTMLGMGLVGAGLAMFASVPGARRPSLKP